MRIVGQLATTERFFTAPPAFISAIEAVLPEGVTFDPCTSIDAFRAALPEATGVIGFPFAAALVRKAPRLRFVHLLTAGIPEGLEAACAELRLSGSGGLNARSVAEHALFLVLAAARGVSSRGLAAWQPDAFRPARPLASLRVAVLGYGAIGAALVPLLMPLVARVRVVSRRAREDSGVTVEGLAAIHEICAESDIVVIALPNRPETRALFGETFFASLSVDVALINVARGALLDERMLLAFLGAHAEARYLADVAVPEPYPGDGALRASDAVLLTPHVGARSVDAWPSLTARAVSELSAALGEVRP